MSKKEVLKIYPKAYAAKAIGGEWLIWSPDVRGILNDPKGFPVYSAKKAWADAARRICSDA